MEQNEVISYFQDLGKVLSPVWVDVIFALLMTIIFLIGMAMGSYRGAWFFLTAIVYFGIGWATAQIISTEFYNSIFKDTFSSTYEKINALRYAGIEVDGAFKSLIGLSYSIILTIGGIVFLSLPLYVFFAKGLKEYNKEISKKKRGLGVFLGGISGIGLFFLSGFGIFLLSSTYANLAYDPYSVKFKNFYCGIMDCSSPEVKQYSDDKELKYYLDEFAKNRDLLNTLVLNENSGKEYTYNQLLKKLFISDGSTSNTDTLDELSDFKNVEILRNLNKILKQHLVFMDKAEEIDDYIKALDFFPNYQFVFGDGFINPSQKENKKRVLVDWLFLIIPDNSLGEFENLRTKIASVSVGQPLFEKIQNEIYSNASLFVIQLSRKLKDIEGLITIGSNDVRIHDFQRINDIESRLPI